MQMRIAVADFVTNTCFPLFAAEELGFFKAEGLDVQVELITPATKAISALREGATDAYAGGSVHAVLKSFSCWKGVKLIAALSQGLPWLLVVRAGLCAERGDMNALKGLLIGADQGPDAALKQLLIASGLDAERDKVQIVPVPGAGGPGVSFGVAAAKALEAGQIDAFWANAMATEIAIRRGVGKVLLDVRRGDGPPAARNFTFSGLVTTDAVIDRDPERIAATVRAIVKTHKALRADPTRAAEVGKRRFSPDAAELIATIIERHLQFYDASISEETVNGLNRFAQSIGLLAEPVSYEQVVAARFRDLWRL
jgi:ABC-type nitrate/sulfonate/bicarbonate transport system substrate-binding protein